MTAWNAADLTRIDEAEELDIAPTRTDGTGLRTPVTIWQVVVDGQLYVRAFMGEKSRWFRAAARQRAGQISSGGVTADVVFDPDVDHALDGAIDAAYLRKYATSPYVAPIVTPTARTHTLRITPAE